MNKKKFNFLKPSKYFILQYTAFILKNSTDLLFNKHSISTNIVFCCEKEEQDDINNVEGNIESFRKFFAYKETNIIIKGPFKKRLADLPFDQYENTLEFFKEMKRNYKEVIQIVNKDNDMDSEIDSEMEQENLQDRCLKSLFHSEITFDLEKIFLLPPREQIEKRISNSRIRDFDFLSNFQNLENIDTVESEIEENKKNLNYLSNKSISHNIDKRSRSQIKISEQSNITINSKPTENLIEEDSRKKLNNHLNKATVLDTSIFNYPFRINQTVRKITNLFLNDIFYKFLQSPILIFDIVSFKKQLTEKLIKGKGNECYQLKISNGKFMIISLNDITDKLCKNVVLKLNEIFHIKESNNYIEKLNISSTCPNSHEKIEFNLYNFISRLSDKKVLFLIDKVFHNQEDNIHDNRRDFVFCDLQYDKFTRTLMIIDIINSKMIRNNYRSEKEVIYNENICYDIEPDLSLTLNNYNDTKKGKIINIKTRKLFNFCLCYFPDKIYEFLFKESFKTNTDINTGYILEIKPKEEISPPDIYDLFDQDMTYKFIDFPENNCVINLFKPGTRDCYTSSKTLFGYNNFLLHHIFIRNNIFLNDLMEDIFLQGDLFSDDSVPMSESINRCDFEIFNYIRKTNKHWTYNLDVPHIIKTNTEGKLSQEMSTKINTSLTNLQKYFIFSDLSQNFTFFYLFNSPKNDNNDDNNYEIISVKIYLWSRNLAVENQAPSFEFIDELKKNSCLKYKKKSVSRGTGVIENNEVYLKNNKTCNCKNGFCFSKVDKNINKAILEDHINKLKEKNNLEGFCLYIYYVFKCINYS